MREAPAWSMALASARERMPPEALTPAREPTTPRMRAMSSTVAPPVEKPVEVLMKSAPAARESSEARSFSSKVSRQVSRMTLTMAPAAWASSTTASDLVLDGVVVLLGGGLEQADVEHHVEVVGAELEDAGGLVALAGGERRAEGKSDDDADRDAGSGEGFDGAGDPRGVDHGAGEAVLGGLVAETDDLGAGGLGLEQGVVEDGGQRGGGGESVRGKGGGVEGRGFGDLEAGGGGC